MANTFAEYKKKRKEEEAQYANYAEYKKQRNEEKQKSAETKTTTTTSAAAAPVSTLTPDERRQRTLNIISQTKGALKAGAEAIRPSGGTVTGTGPTKYAQYRREIEDLTKSGASGQLIKAKKNEFNQYKTDIYNEKRERRKANLLNKAEKDPDFAAMVEKGKNIYDTVNKEKDRKKFTMSFSPENMSHVGAGDMEDWASRNYKLNNFTDDERNTYLYILGKEGWTAADKYEELISRDVNARTAAKETEFLTDWARKNKPAAVALNTASSFLGGAALADTVRQGIRNAGRSDTEFVPADNNSGAFIAPRVQAAMTEGITGDIKSPAGKFMAQTGLSTANFLANAAVGGGAVSLGLMGANAGGSGAYEAIERGATPGQAAMLGLVNAAAEIAFERIPVGEFGKLASGDVKKTFARAMIDMAKEEGMEELATEYVNLLGDNIIMGDNSEMRAYIRELMAQGMSEDEAKKAALSEFAVKRPAMAFLGGAVSGAGIGAAGAGIGRVNMMTDPAVREIVNAVQESQPGMSKAKAWGVVMQAIQGNGADAENIPENTENNTANAENVPQEFEAFNEAAQEAGGQDWREELISAVMENSGMSRADAERAVSQASGDIVREDEQNEPERIWERAAREQAAYDAEWERAHQPTAETPNWVRTSESRDEKIPVNPTTGIWSQPQYTGQDASVDEYSRYKNSPEYLRWVDQEARNYQKGLRDAAINHAFDRNMNQTEDERQANAELTETEEDIRRGENTDDLWSEEDYKSYDNAEQTAREDYFRRDAISNATENFRKRYYYPGPVEDFEGWLMTETESNGIPEIFKNKPIAYANYMYWLLEQQTQANYKNAKGKTMQGKMKNALKQAIADIKNGEIDTGINLAMPEEQKKIPRAAEYLDENPEGGEQFVTENYGKGETGLWGTEVLKNADEREAREKTGQAYEIAKRRVQEAADKLIRKDKKRRKQRGKDFLSPIERNTVESLISEIFDVPGGQNAETRRVIMNNVMKQIERGNLQAVFSNGHRVNIPQNVDRKALMTMVPLYVEQDALEKQYREMSGDLKTIALEQADRMSEYMDEAEDYKTPIQYYLQDPYRIFRGIFKTRPDIAQRFTDTYVKPYADNNADMNRMQNEIKDNIRSLNIDTGNKKTYALSFSDKGGNSYYGDYNESAILQIYGEKLISDQELEMLRDKQGNKIDADKIRHARDVIKAEYKRLLKSINNVLVEYGYTPSLEIQDYFPHYNESSIQNWEAVLQKIGLDMHADELPTAIAARTEGRRPGKQWFGNILERQGYRTTYDAIGGFDKYLNVAGNIIYHTGDVQKLRALGESVRHRYSDALYQDEMRDLKESRIRQHLTAEQYNERAGAAREDLYTRMRKMNNFVQWVDEQANIEAGKQSFMDRALETFFGRKVLKRSEEIVKRAGRNMVNGNISASLTNIIPIVQDETGAKYKLQGLKDTITEGLRRDDFVDRSTFLTNRYGSKTLVPTKLDTFADKAGFLMEAIDHITAESLVRARYMQNVAEGMSEDAALSEADEHVASVMADRTRGLAPAVFNVKNPFIKIFTQFQTEMLNQYEHSFMDVPREYRQKYGKKFAAYLTAYWFKLLLGYFMYNEVSEKITHRRAATDPIDIAWEAINNSKDRQRNNLLDVLFKGENLYEDKKVDKKEAETQTAKRIIGEVPIIGSVLGGRIPLSDALPSISTINDARWAAKNNPEASEKSRNKIIKEVIKPAAYLGAPTMGLQAKKTAEGLYEMAKGGSYVKDNKGKDILRYPVDNTNPANWVKNAVFGRTASEGYQKWKRNGFKNLSARQTEAYPKIVQSGIDYDTYMQFVFNISGVNSKWETARTIYDMKGLTNAQKNIIWKNAVRADYAEKGNQPDFTMKKNEFYDTWHGKEDKE